MARRLRIQFEGALYHVINRGNYRRDIFSSDGASRAFLTALGEACERHTFKIHAHVLMRNHYHLALETPHANLVEGMHWLQSTFSSRFNRFRRVQGHLFQGRYQALLVEDAAALTRVVSYIHLNPLRAKLTSPDAVASYPGSSLRSFVSDSRPSWLTPHTFLESLGLSDSKIGWKKYLAYLSALGADPLEQSRQGFDEMHHGWAIGTNAWRETLARTHRHLSLTQDIAAAELLDLKEARWQETLDSALERHAKSSKDVGKDPKSAHWKIEVAILLRRSVAAPHRWIAEKLNMGSPAAVRVNVARFS